MTNYALQKSFSSKYIEDKYLAEDLSVLDTRFEVLARLHIKIKSSRYDTACFGTHALPAPFFKIEKIAFMLS